MTELRMTPERWNEAEEGVVENPGFSLWEYLWVLSDVYELPLTNNEPRIQDGTQLREISDYLCDVREAFLRAGWLPRTAPRDLAWKEAHPTIKGWSE